MEIASNLGIGLIRISNGRPKEVLASRDHRPIARMRLDMARKLKVYQCRICGSFVESTGNYKAFAKNKILNAIKRDRGLIFWHDELARRKKRLKISKHGDEDSYERRVVCRECVSTLFAPLVSAD